MTTVPAQGDLPPLSDERILEAFREVIGAGLEGRFERLSQAIQFARAIERLAIELSRRQEASTDSKIQSLIDHRAATIDDELSRERAFSRRLMAQRDALADELDALAAGRQEASALQAKIDALMLEYCPDEMTDEQRANWAAHQRPIDDAAGRQEASEPVAPDVAIESITEAELATALNCTGFGDFTSFEAPAAEVFRVARHLRASMPESPKAGE